MGFTISFLDENIVLRTRTISNLKMLAGHTTRHVCDIIRTVISERVGARIPKYFLSDSAPVKKLAVRMYMGRDGDEYWFPCGIHFCQLAMKESLPEYLSVGTVMETNSMGDNDWDELSGYDVLKPAVSCSNCTAFTRITSKCRAIRASLKRILSFTSHFSKYQCIFNIHVSIKGGVRNRFDSTLLMFESVLKGEEV